MHLSASLSRTSTRPAAAKYIHVCAPFLVAAVLSICATPVAGAARGFTTTGAVLVTDVMPGEILKHRITVGIGDEDATAQIGAVVGGVGQQLDGTYLVLDGSQDDPSTSARSFVTLDKSSFTVKPGETQELIATIQVPQMVGDGGRYAVINVQTRGLGQPDVGAISAVNIPIYLTIAGTRIVHTAKIVRIQADEPTDGQPFDIITTFQNTGNHHFRARAEVTVFDDTGGVLDTIHSVLTGPSVIPGMTRDLKATFIPQREVSPGQYSARSKLMLEDGTLLAEGTSTFAVEEPYVPPPPPVEAMITPSSGGVIMTSGGEITIDFPAGAVTTDASIAIRGYPTEQLPAPPSGMNLTTTSFRVDGMNGLLAKPAVLTVRYSAADARISPGDISRLVLSRWDSANMAWVILNTRNDEKTATLTASTNQLGLWTVMVRESRPAAGPWVPIELMAGVTILCLSIILVLSKRRRIV